MSEPINTTDAEIPITLPERHWVVILGLLEDFIHRICVPKIKQMQTSGIDPKAISQAEVTATIGPVFARGIIVKELVARGVMKQEADDKLGIDKLLALAQQFKDEDA